MLVGALAGAGGVPIYMGTASGTTTSGGNLLTDVSSTDKYVIGAFCSDVAGVTCFPFAVGGGLNVIAFRCTDSSQAGYVVKAETAVTIQYFYVKH